VVCAAIYGNSSRDMAQKQAAMASAIFIAVVKVLRAGRLYLTRLVVYKIKKISIYEGYIYLYILRPMQVKVYSRTTVIAILQLFFIH
jgi:hypothetical protein